MAQATDTVLMIRPAAFRSNPETAGSNAFQHPRAMAVDAAHAAALREFDGMVVKLRDAGVMVCAVADDPEPPRPDAIFPNNWFTTHADGTVVLYPMHAPSRRLEVRTDVVDALGSRFGYRVGRVLDLTPYAGDGRHLEGTGSMVLDRVHRVAYACASVRTDIEVLDRFCAELGYEPFMFAATDGGGVPIYHTNVMMWIGTRIAGICLDAVGDAAVRDALLKRVEDGGRGVVELTHAQMGDFAGNMLELRTTDGEPVIVMSARAHASLDDAQRAMITAHATPVVADIPSIETVSGGSVRCMLAEVFLPPA